MDNIDIRKQYLKENGLKDDMERLLTMESKYTKYLENKIIIANDYLKIFKKTLMED